MTRVVPCRIGLSKPPTAANSGWICDEESVRLVLATHQDAARTCRGFESPLRLYTASAEFCRHAGTASAYR